MRRINELLSLLTVIGLAFQCKNRQAIYSGTFGGNTYQLTAVETKGFSTNSISYELTLGRLKPVAIDALTTNWGPPYADDLYGNAPRMYIPAMQHRATYHNENTDTTLFGGTMLYLSPKRFSRAVFDDYARLMKQAWAAIDARFGHEKYSRFPLIIGLVYGQPADSRLVFRGQKETVTYELTVEPDGRILYAPVKTGANYEYSGLSAKVQMPGKRIYVSTAPNAGAVYGGVSMAQLKTYRDATGKTPGDYFTLIRRP